MDELGDIASAAAGHGSGVEQHPIPGKVLAWTAVAALLTLTTHTDPDLWGHLRFGLDWLRAPRWPAADPYSFTQDIPWINHEWASEVALAVAYRAGGPTGLLVLKALLTAGALALIAWLLRGATPLLYAAWLILIGWSGLPLVNTHRPQLWSWLAVPALLALLSKPQARLVVPVLFAVWANLHGGWLVGVGLLSVWAADRWWLEGGWYPVKLWILSAVATLATPYGIGLWQFMAETVRLGRPQIQEWQPVWTAPAVSWIPLLVTWALVLGGIVRRRTTWIITCGLVGLGVASLRVMRLVPFFVVAAAIWTAPLPQTRRRSPVVWMEAIAAGVLLMCAWSVTGRTATCWQADPAWAPDPEVSLAGVRGRLAVPFGWGEYALWAWGPDLQVSLDGRRETVYSDAVVAPQFALADNQSTAWLDDHPPDVAWYPQRMTLARRWFEAHGYVLRVDTPRSYVFARAGIQIPPVVAARPGCFPHP